MDACGHEEAEQLDHGQEPTELVPGYSKDPFLRGAACQRTSTTDAQQHVSTSGYMKTKRLACMKACTEWKLKRPAA
jgi:hypothetical protein